MCVPHPSNGKSQGDQQSHSRLVTKGSTCYCSSCFARNQTLLVLSHLHSDDAICPHSWYSVTRWVLKGQPRVAGCGLRSVVLEREVVQIGPHSQQTGVPSGPDSSPTPSLTHLTRQLRWDLSQIAFHHPTCFSPVAYTNLENICLHSNITWSSSPEPLPMPNMFCSFYWWHCKIRFSTSAQERELRKKQERKTEEEKISTCQSC